MQRALRSPQLLRQAFGNTSRVVDMSLLSRLGSCTDLRAEYPQISSWLQDSVLSMNSLNATINSTMNIFGYTWWKRSPLGRTPSTKSTRTLLNTTISSARNSDDSRTTNPWSRCQFSNMFGAASWGTLSLLKAPAEAIDCMYEIVIVVQRVVDLVKICVARNSATSVNMSARLGKHEKKRFHHCTHSDQRNASRVRGWFW